MKVASFFSGAGGLDLGFSKAGFEINYANDSWEGVKATYESNHGPLDTRDIREVHPSDLPDVDGFVGGPPCQSWSEAGSMRGTKDKRGQTFLYYQKLISTTTPKFFVAENVKGLLAPRNKKFLDNLRADLFQYNLAFVLLNVVNYGIPQRRQRVFVVGYHKDFKKVFTKPSEPLYKNPDLADIFYRLDQPEPRYKGGFSSRFLSRQRVAGWSEPSYTIVASARQIPLHPKSPKMVKIKKDLFEIQPGSRRLSVPECAAIQDFPEDYTFVYSETKIEDAYKMISNAVPPGLARVVATQIFDDLGG